MGIDWLRSRGAAWCALWVLNALAMGGGAGVAGYALFPLRADKLEVLYRAEDVPFMAGPGGVPADKWQRMTVIDHEIVEPLANWVVAVAVALAVISAVSVCLLSRLSSVVSEPATAQTATAGPANPATSPSESS
jgi:hypothetical protein